ncbi:MAG TPA: AcvB/VirJ family lysyl-phosphatidylglycerol hydrolase [Blastocatellia bacterium]|nr:AcvB/VirJ family lysyl-phosphatidylglycerol hydrolase [Blastocatellia bacterium]
MKLSVRKFSLLSFGALALALALWLLVSSFAQATCKTLVTVRGQKQEVYYYPATGTKLNRKVLFAPGDGGWRGWAITIAQQMAGWGYDVYGLDTKTYLGGFTDGAGIKVSDVMSDFRQIAQWMTKGANERVTLVGWSEGAGLGVLAVAGAENKRYFNGLVTFGLEDVNVLGWSWKDNLTYITKSTPNEPIFHASDYMAKIAPLPYLMIQSSKDEYAPFDETMMLATAASEPKRVSIIQANNHRFDGNTGEFYNQLREGLQWMK